MIKPSSTVLVLLGTITTLLTWSQPSHAAISKEAAIQKTKQRIEALFPYVGRLTHTCYVYDEECIIAENPKYKGFRYSAVLKWIQLESVKYDVKTFYSSNQDDFLIDGAYRIAKTQEVLGAPVYFNENLLYRKGSDDSFIPLSFWEILAVLVHELGHHQNPGLKDFGLATLDHEELDLMAAKVVTFSQNRGRRIVLPMPATHPEAVEASLNWFYSEDNIGIRMPSSFVFIDDHKQVRELSKPLITGVRCPKEYQEGHLVFDGKPWEIIFYNVSSPRFSEAGGGLHMSQEIGEAKVLCADETMGRYDIFDGYKNGLLSMDFSLEPEGYSFSSVNLKIDSPPDKN